MKQIRGPKIYFDTENNSLQRLQNTWIEEKEIQNEADQDFFIENNLKANSSKDDFHYHIRGTKNFASHQQSPKRSNRTKTSITFNQNFVVCLYQKSKPPKSIQKSLNQLKPDQISWVNPEAYKNKIKQNKIVNS